MFCFIFWSCFQCLRTCSLLFHFYVQDNDAIDAGCALINNAGECQVSLIMMALTFCRGLLVWVHMKATTFTVAMILNIIYSSWSFEFLWIHAGKYRAYHACTVKPWFKPHIVRESLPTFFRLYHSHSELLTFNATFSPSVTEEKRPPLRNKRDQDMCIQHILISKLYTLNFLDGAFMDLVRLLDSKKRQINKWPLIQW